MAMTRKDYRAIAGAIKSASDESRYPGNLFMDAAAKRALRRVIYRLGTMFLSEHPRFDRHKFEDACGTVGVYNSTEEFTHLDDPNNLEAYARDTSKQKRKPHLAKVG
jgi:hypothetical protein